MATLTTPSHDRLLRIVRTRGRRAFEAFVRRAGGARLERIAGSRPALRLIFAAMTRAYEPDKAQGFAGELEFDLRRADGRAAHWVVSIDRRRGRPDVRPPRRRRPAPTRRRLHRPRARDRPPGASRRTRADAHTDRRRL